MAFKFEKDKFYMQPVLMMVIILALCISTAKSLVYLQKKKEANYPNIDFEDMLRVSEEKEEKE